MPVNNDNDNQQDSPITHCVKTLWCGLCGKKVRQHCMDYKNCNQ